MRLRMGGLSKPEIGLRRIFLMTPQVLHDTLRIFGTSLSVAVGAVAVAVFGSLLWSESNSSPRPAGCSRQAKTPRAR